MALILGGTVLAIALMASAAAAGTPSVTVRVEGLTETLLPPAQVTTSAEGVVKDGRAQDACGGTTAIGALQVATGGAWGGPWSETYRQYAIGSIQGESHEFGSGYYWSFWLNHTEAQVGACEAGLETGEEVLFFPCSESAGCGSPLGVQAPSTADVGEPVTVTVVSYAPNGTPTPLAGATVSAGLVAEKTDASGHATLSIPGPGSITLRAQAPEAVRAETTVCVHSGNDGTCGTIAPVKEGTPPPAGTAPAPPSYKGPFALVPDMTGLIEGGVYRRGQAPRLLAGTIRSHSAVSAVRLVFRREYRGRCYSYEGLRERFLPTRCGRGSAFLVSSGSGFSYLLPSALAPGRYVLDVLATDVLGNRTTLARGTSRLVFYVR